MQIQCFDLRKKCALVPGGRQDNQVYKQRQGVFLLCLRKKQKN